MMGTLTTNPKTTRLILSLAAPAMAITLSRLITASAMMIVLIAPSNVVLASIVCPLCPVQAEAAWCRSTASSNAAKIFRNGIASRLRAKKIKHHSQSDGAEYTPENPEITLLLRQAAGMQGQ